MKIILTSSNEFIYEMIDKYESIPIDDLSIIEFGYLTKDQAKSYSK